MADYCKKFSVTVELPTEAAQRYARELAEDAAGYFLRDDPLPADFPADLLHALEEASEDSVDWRFETEKDDEGIFLHADYGGGGPEVACMFIQHLLRKFDPTGVVAFEWSRDCIPPREDGYGGGAAIITAQEIKMMRTRAWLDQQISGLSGSTPRSP